MPRALITGATGLVGSYIAERLLADGWTLRALVRTAASTAWLRARGVEILHGDVVEGEVVATAAKQCDAIVHAAAAITPRGGWEAYRATNVDGTSNAITAAQRSAARLLHVSSVAVYGPGARYNAGGVAHEGNVMRPLPGGAYYARSKRQSEQMVLSAHASGRIWATAVRPSVIYGERDRQFTPRVARVFDRGLAPLIGRGRTRLAIVHAANVADGAVRALAADVAGGKAYNLANDYDVTVAEFVRLAGTGLGRRIRTLRIPRALATGGATIARRVAMVVGRPHVGIAITSSVDFLARDNPFSSELARRELGWSPPLRPEEGIPAAFRWWKQRRRDPHSSR